MRRTSWLVAAFGLGWGLSAQAGLLIRNHYVVSVIQSSSESHHLGVHLESEGLQTYSPNLREDEWVALCNHDATLETTQAGAWFVERVSESQLELQELMSLACSL